ncbi:MAG: rRNA maturation RNase YbeY [Gammaproteobacteria bacterium]|jgi:probable rRNA maturation factor|nr:rRNA maturation RNase YbeY [Gammaproteobacteria bacterium]MDP6732721.1 rRNA maturation RNase YbeY [Gammaproteobacteria bacterium]|tara:strand:- start:6 stop:479 length:474 start_codon:yes stop_codon:yes gene_type:complete
MNVTVEISNDCDYHWVPEQDVCANWIKIVMDLVDTERTCSISLRFVDEAEAESLNSQFRGQPHATNVLSFPVELPAAVTQNLPTEPLGDVVICPAILEREACEQGKTQQAHCAHLLIHGVLHLLGYQHDDSSRAEAMERLEIKALEILGFPNPYLVG